jgi:hypothetical protein
MAVRFRGQRPTVERNGLADVILEGAQVAQPPRYSGTGDGDLVVETHFGLGMLITQDCELDKPDPVFLVAPLVDIRTFGEKAVEGIRELQKFRWFYLPPYSGSGRLTSWGHAVADFAGSTPLAPNVLASLDRVVSLAPEVRAALQAALMRYLARVEPRKLAAK